MMNLKICIDKVIARHEDLSRINLAFYDEHGDSESVQLAMIHRQFAHELRQAINESLRFTEISAELIGCEHCGSMTHYTQNDCRSCGNELRGFF